MRVWWSASCGTTEILPAREDLRQRHHRLEDGHGGAPVDVGAAEVEGVERGEGLVAAIEAEGVAETACLQGGAGVGVEGVGFADGVGEETGGVAELDGEAGAGPGDLVVLALGGE